MAKQKNDHKPSGAPKPMPNNSHPVQKGARKPTPRPTPPPTKQ